MAKNGALLVEPVIVVHGGAWAIPDKLADASRSGVRRAALVGYGALLDGRSAVDAVEATVTWLENDPAFDAGRGSVLTSDGHIEMDSMIMDGKDLSLGSIAGVRTVQNPVQLARKVMEKSPHTMLVGSGADRFARSMGIPEVSLSELITEGAIQELEEFKKFHDAVDASFHQGSGHDTVGALALDRHGNIACATSTGGITAKMAGRVGDSPLVGSGGYADSDTGAVSCTGHGEAIMRVCLAHRIVSSVGAGKSVQSAVEEGIRYMKRRTESCGGAIVLDKDGKFATFFNTERMAWSAVKKNVLQYGLDPHEVNEEIVLPQDFDMADHHSNGIVKISNAVCMRRHDANAPGDI